MYSQVILHKHLLKTMATSIVDNLLLTLVKVLGWSPENIVLSCNCYYLLRSRRVFSILDFIWSDTCVCICYFVLKSKDLLLAMEWNSSRVSVILFDILFHFFYPIYHFFFSAQCTLPIFKNLSRCFFWGKGMENHPY